MRDSTTRNIGCMTGSWGSLGVIEAYFGGELGTDVLAADLQKLSDDQFHDLRLGLSAVTPGYDPGEVGAAAWRAGQDLSPRASALIGGWSGPDVVTAALYARQLLVADPLAFARSASDVASAASTLIAWRPLIVSGAFVLYPATIAMDAAGPTYSLESRPVGRWPNDVKDWAEELLQVLPQGQVGEVARSFMSRLVAAAAFDVDTVAIGRYAPLLPPALMSGGLRTWALASVIVPRNASLQAKDVADLRENSDGYRSLRAALDDVLDALPSDPDDVLRKGSAIAREILEPRAEQLARETRRSPTLSAWAAASWAMSATAVDLGLGQASPGTLMVAGAIPVGLLADWVRRSRRRADAGPQLRVLQTLNSPPT